jgi:hypothetical protein
VFFAVNWFLDVFFRSSRDIHYWVSLTIGFFSAGTLLWIAYRFVPFVAAITAAAGFMAISTGYVFEWSTITFYLLSISFFGLGFIFLIDDQEKLPQKISWRSLIFLMLSTLFHELAAISILSLTVLAIYLENKERKLFIIHLFTVSLVWLLLYALAMFLLNPDGFYSTGEWQRLINTMSSYNSETLLYLKKLFFIVLKPGIIIGVFLICTVWYVRKPENRLSWKEKWTLIGFGVPMVCLVTGLFVGRVLTRGGYSSWYQEMFLYFFFVVSAVFMSLIFRKGKVWKMVGWVLIIFLIVQDIRLLNIRADLIQDREAQRPIWSDLVSDIRNYFEEHSENCLAGMRGLHSAKINESYKSIFAIKDVNDVNVKKDLNTIFFYQSCGFRKNAEPTYLNIARGNLEKRYSFKPLQEAWHEETEYKLSDLTLETLPQHLRTFQVAASKKAMDDIWWVRNPQKPVIKIDESCVRSKDIYFSEARLDISSEDISPISYNFTIHFQVSGDREYLITFRANEVELVEVDSKTKLKALNFRNIYLNAMPKEFSVRFKSAGDGIEVFFQEQLLGLLPTEQSKSSHVIQVCPFENSTPHEKVKSFSYVKL